MCSVTAPVLAAGVAEDEARADDAEVAALAAVDAADVWAALDEACVAEALLDVTAAPVADAAEAEVVAVAAPPQAARRPSQAAPAAPARETAARRLRRESKPKGRWGCAAIWTSSLPPPSWAGWHPRHQANGCARNLSKAGDHGLVGAEMAV
jgi:hypothetical protein